MEPTNDASGLVLWLGEFTCCGNFQRLHWGARGDLNTGLLPPIWLVGFYSFFRVFLRGFGNKHRFSEVGLPLYPI